MRIGIPREAAVGQPVVAGSPFNVAALIKLGYDVCVESGAGVFASFSDELYEKMGATIVGTDEAWASDIVLCFDSPNDNHIALMKDGATLIARLNPWADKDLPERYAKRGITALALDAVPRISRAQSLDVRSSMANVSGYRAVIEAASHLGRTFGGQVTAAGKVTPAKVYVIGVGVAGLAAIGQAGSMGAEVYATDVRSDVADQVQSLGATFVEIPVKQESTDGYARALDLEEQARVLEVYTKQAAKCDVVITTAQVPGRPAPLLLTAEAVAGMRPGSVVVDMGASEFGGNCELSKPDEIVTTENGVTILGFQDLYNRLPAQSSQLYGQNIVNFIKLCTPGKDGELVLDQEDVVVRGVTVTLGRDIMWPPPPVNVSVAMPVQENVVPAEVAKEEEAAQAKEDSKLKGIWWKVLLAALVVLLIMTAPAEMAGHFFVFALACVVGFYVITNVTHTLHTPLMSVTNAISGIIIVGALLLVGSDNIVVVVLSFIAMAIAAINIFGGFLVTNRMLKMFERSSE